MIISTDITVPYQYSTEAESMGPLQSVGCDGQTVPLICCEQETATNGPYMIGFRIVQSCDVCVL